MRPQLLVSGVLVALLGVGFFLLEIPIVFSWSLVFIAGGAAMAGTSFFVPAGSGPVPPPDGYRFCRFCSSPVPLGAERCLVCNGLQQGGGQ
jgi:hypothetical protein